MKTAYALLASLTAQAAVAWNFSAQPYISPQYANNECSAKQQNGFDWSIPSEGETNFQYDNFDFSAGWKCTNPVVKREAFAARATQNKAITNACTKSKPASFGSTKKPDGFSIATIDLTADHYAEVDLHYTLVDGSVCKQTKVPCKKGGSTVTNTQCGAAKKVDIYLSGGCKESEVKIGIHKIEFECSPRQKYSEPAVPTSAEMAAQYGGSLAEAQPSSSQKPSSSSVKARSSPVPSSSASRVASSSTSRYCNEGYGQGCVSTKASSTVTRAVPTSSKFTSMIPPKNSSTIKTSQTVAVSPRACTAKASSSPKPVVKSPEVLPTCMSTWLQITTTDCLDNTAADCYCKNPKFTKAVTECVQAWSPTDDDMKDSLRYLVGICAKYVPENPSLIEDCPPGTFNSPIIPKKGENATTTKPTLAPSATPAGNTVAIIFYGSTSIAVPAIHFSIGTPAAGATLSVVVGFVVGAAPPMTTASTTPEASLAPYQSGSNSTMATATGSLRPTSTKTKPSDAKFTGAASLVQMGAGQVVLGAALALFAL